MSGIWCHIALLVLAQASDAAAPAKDLPAKGAVPKAAQSAKDKAAKSEPVPKAKRQPADSPPHPNVVETAATAIASRIRLDTRTLILLGTVLGLLITAFIIGRALRRSPESAANPAVVRTFNNRVLAWWMMFAVLTLGILTQSYVFIVVLFGLVSFWALREYITMTPTRRADHRTLFLIFLVLLPGHYFLVALGERMYGFYTTLIPVYASLLIPAQMAISGDPKRFLERAAKVQAGLLICVYALSHAPALLSLDLMHSDRTFWIIDPIKRQRGSNASLLFYFILLTQLNDVFGYLWGQLFGRHVIAPQINASRTWEGFAGGLLSTMLVGMGLWWSTPFRFWEAPFMAMAISIAGFAGGMTMSAIKRDRGVSDYGTLVTGHAGVLDRIDSICFAAPVFFHLTRYFFSAA